MAKGSEAIVLRFQKSSPALWAALAAVLIATLLPLTEVGDLLERRTYDTRFHLRGPRPSDAHIVIVEIDDRTEHAWPEPSIFWTARYASLIRQARQAGARVIGFDLIPETSGDSYLESLGVSENAARPDREFARAIQAAGKGRIVLSDLLTPREGKTVEPADYLLRMSALDGNIGFADLPSSPDGVIRESFASIPALRSGAPTTGSADSDFATLESLPRLIALRYWETFGTGRIPAAIEAIPTESVSTFYVNFTGAPLPKISALDLESGSLSPAERARFKDAAVLVGITSSGGGDKHTGPGRRVYSGVYLQGQALATLLDGRPLHRLSPIRESAITLAIGLLAIVFVMRLSFWQGALTEAALAAVLLVSVQTGFQRFDALLPIAAPLLGISGSWLAFHTARSVEERLLRQRIERDFGRYTSERIRDFLLANPRHAQLGGQEQEITVMFMDLRGSTAYAQNRDPEEFLEELNAFFADVVPVLDNSGGLLYRYTGDGFLAVFGAPMPLASHALTAVQCAADLVRAVHAGNKKRQAAGKTPWRIGCALNTGIAACGNLGTESRAEYTVIGDTVNLAAKIEGLNKDHASDIVLTAATANAAGMTLPGVLLASESARIGDRTERIDLYFLGVQQDNGEERP